MARDDFEDDAPASPERRNFIKKTGRFAAAAPAVTLLLSTTLASEAVARSGGSAPRRRSGGGGGGLGGLIDKLVGWLFRS